jgi:KDO2-lipid IV(A) lauroyltransferase
MGYYLLFGFAWLSSLIPFWLLYRISDVLYIVNFYLVGYRKKIVYRNLRNSFPEKTQEEIDHIARAFYRHFSDFLVESVKCLSIPRKQYDKRFRFMNLEVIRQLEAENRSFAMVSAHYSNWEWMTFLSDYVAHTFLVIYRPLQNKVMDRLSRKMRSRGHPVLVPMEQVFREALKFRSENRLLAVWFLADQRPPRTNRFWTTFLNQEASFFEGIEKMSRKLNLPIVFLDIQKTKRGHYEAWFTKLFDNTAETRDYEIMLTCIRKMEEQIKAKPEFWLWSHNRFKHARPEQINLITS